MSVAQIYKVVSIFTCFLVYIPYLSGQNIEIRVLACESSTPLPGTVVSINDENNYVSDDNGEVKIPKEDTLFVRIQRIGFETVRDTLYYNRTASDQDKITYRLCFQNIQIETIEVLGQSQRPTERQIGLFEISKEDIKSAPSILGENDVIQAIKRQSGLQSGGDATAGYYVRGGSVDQNLVLMDKATLFNPNHLFGFFSVFNPYGLGQVNFNKAGFKASQGGRVSSILDVTIANGSLEKSKGNLKISTIASSASYETPIIKEKLSLFLAARRTYIDQLSKILFDEDSEIRNRLNSFFFDFNGKLYYRPSQKDAISLTFFNGRDGFNFRGENDFANEISWTNQLQSFNWTHSWHKNISQDFNLHHTDYKVNYEASISDYLVQIFSSIKEYGAGSNVYLDDLISNHSITVGYDIKDYEFVPNTFDITADEQPLNTLEAERLLGRESALYLNDELKISKDLVLNLGLRQSFYAHLGAFNRYNTDANLIITDTVSFQAGERIKSYQTTEPRLSMRYNLSENSSIKVAYDVTAQYVHLAPISSVSLPTDVWVPSSSKLPPQRGVQYSAEYSRIIEKLDAWITLGAYYKEVTNVVEYQNAILLGYGTSGFNFDDNFLSGFSTSKGLELTGMRRWDNFDINLSYTLSETTRQFEEFNNNIPFPAKYDSRHNGNLSLAYQISPRASLTTLFQYSTGNAITIPIGRYIIEGNVVSDYGRRNNFRLPPYHRMDLSLEIKNKRNGVWNFTVFNAYNRKNPYFVYFDTRGNLEEYELSIELKRVALFPIIPGISYSTTF